MTKEYRRNSLEAWEKIEKMKKPGSPRKNKEVASKGGYKGVRDGEIFLLRMFYPF
ncbi:hypothetical protein [Neobacillus notoginsengisoli]|uniref:hypothetical protein n=1 Tax=Neobacillus notoginsengisoli TaxID=1578198 RepID=UPI0013143DE3|nr:hypothetical protein [Neobacillus notoginsengisoli]